MPFIDICQNKAAVDVVEHHACSVLVKRDITAEVDGLLHGIVVGVWREEDLGDVALGDVVAVQRRAIWVHTGEDSILVRVLDLSPSLFPCHSGCPGGD